VAATGGESAAASGEFRWPPTGRSHGHRQAPPSTREYVTDIAPDSRVAPFHANLKQLPLTSHVIRLSQGDSIQVLADVKHRMRSRQARPKVKRDRQHRGQRGIGRTLQ
jgi:hypothetical protein